MSIECKINDGFVVNKFLLEVRGGRYSIRQLKLHPNRHSLPAVRSAYVLSQ